MSETLQGRTSRAQKPNAEGAISLVTFVCDSPEEPLRHPTGDRRRHEHPPAAAGRDRGLGHRARDTPEQPVLGGWGHERSAGFPVACTDGGTPHRRSRAPDRDPSPEAGHPTAILGRLDAPVQGIGQARALRALRSDLAEPRAEGQANRRLHRPPYEPHGRWKRSRSGLDRFGTVVEQGRVAGRWTGPWPR